MHKNSEVANQDPAAYPTRKPPQIEMELNLVSIKVLWLLVVGQDKADIMEMSQIGETLNPYHSYSTKA